MPPHPQVYKELIASNSFVEKLLDMYRHGKQYGWEPAQWPKRLSSAHDFPELAETGHP